MNEKLSVIIPLYNKGPYIARAIDSVLKQTIQNFEIIVVDGGSDDDGPKIVNFFNNSKILFFVQNGKGVSNARNEGVKFASSDFVAFLDADDEWMPHHLETIFRLIEKFPEAGMFTTAWKIQTPEGTTRWANYQCIPNPPWEGLLPDYFKSGAHGDSPVWTSAVVIPGKIFHEMGGFPEGYWYGEDLDLFGKIALKYPVAFSWEFGAIYHTEALNRTCDRGFPLDYEEPFIKTARIAITKKEVPQNLIASLNEYIWIKEYVRAVRNVQAGNFDTAQIILKQCNAKGHSIEKMKWMMIAKMPQPIYFFLRDVRRNLIKIVRKKIT